MREEEAGENEREDLSSGHHDGEDDGPMFSNREEDEQLSDGRSDREDHIVEQRLGVLDEEGNASESLAALQKTERGETT